MGLYSPMVTKKSDGLRQTSIIMYEFHFEYPFCYQKEVKFFNVGNMLHAQRYPNMYM